MRAAMSPVQGGEMSINRAAIEHGVPKTTLGHGNEIHSFWSPPASKKNAASSFFNTVQRLTRMHRTASYHVNMLVSVSISAGFCLILPWSIMVFEESCSLVELYTGIHDGSIEVPSTSSCPFEFPNTYKEQPFSVVVASKLAGPFQPCNLVAKLGEVAAFGTHLKFLVERPKDTETAANKMPRRSLLIKP